MNDLNPNQKNPTPGQNDNKETKNRDKTPKNKDTNNHNNEANKSKKKPDQKTKNFLNNLEKKLKSEEQKKSKNTGKNKTTGKKNGQDNKNQTLNRISLFIFLTILGLTIFSLNNEPSESENREKIKYSDFIKNIKNRNIDGNVKIINNKQILFQKNGKAFETETAGISEKLENLLIENNIDFEYKTKEKSQFLLILFQFLPWIIFIALIWFMFSRQLKGKGGAGLNFGQSRAQLINEESIKERFTDIKGCDEAKSELEEVIQFLKSPQRYIKIGARIPKGVLLVGPPGTGKTMMAKAVAGESGVKFFSMSGSDFVEMFVGVGASRVRDLFQKGRKNAPCIIFIDELDAVGRMRGAGYGGGHDEREQTLNQMLVEMDGFEPTDSVIIIAATNRPDVLDKALLRPGRFDRQVIVDLPDVIGRKAILEVHSKKIKIEKDVSFDYLAKGTPGFSGADLANMVNEAAIITATKKRKKVSLNEFEEAKDKIILGKERKSLLVNDDEKRISAWHEAGHALVGVLMEKADQLHKVSIIPRGRALGITSFLPEDGKHTLTKSKLESQLRMIYGGRAAEEIIFGDISNGAANDIDTATRIARSMVCEWGMSELGPISYSEQKEPVFLGRDIARHTDISEESFKKVDDEIKILLDKAYRDSVALLKENRDKLQKIADLLIEKETVTVFEIYEAIEMPVPEKVYKKVDDQ